MGREKDPVPGVDKYLPIHLHSFTASSIEKFPITFQIKLLPNQVLIDSK